MIMQRELLEVNEMIGRFNPKELPPTISSHLKDVEIICGGVDGPVLKILKFLSKLNISKLASNTLTLSIFHFVWLNIWVKVAGHELFISY